MKKTYQLEEIFTPSQPAKHTFVERSSVKKRLDRAFRTPGKQIIIYGYSGAGKTTLLRNKLETENINYITTPCIKGMSISDIVIDAFNQLEIYFTQGKETVESNKVGGTLSASYLGLKTSLGAETKGDSKISKRRAVELPITPQTLAKFIGESENCWVIEDFHKIESSNKIQMAQIMKVFMDASVNYPKLKIIAIGAVNSAREVVQFDPEMKNRITELQVPLMNEESLNEILNTGEKLLNIKIPTKIVDRIVSYSSGLPAVTHQLGLLLCEVNKIFQTHDSSKVFEITQSSFEIALDEYLEENSDSLKAVYEFATRIIHKRKNENASDILRAILTVNNESISLNDIKEVIQLDDKNYKGTNLKKYVDELTTPSRSEILRFNENSMTYYFNNPFIKAYCQCVLRNNVKGKINSSTLLKEFRKTLNKELEIARRAFLKDISEL
ncbi:hypothetical protein DZC78_04100 [Olleya aquimaris]|nr:hypothetical protein DZC78_04100 [Olleya aquimaris]